MKKIALVLACAASLGLWISCDNGAQDLDITLHSGVDKKNYDNKGTVTAKKITMVTHKGVAVMFDGELPINKPTDRNDYYRQPEYGYDKEGKITSVEYWFYNDWDDGTDVTFDNAFVSWESNVSYNGYADASTGTENVTNAKIYQFGLGVINNDENLWNEILIQKSGNVYQYAWDANKKEDYKDTYGSAALEVSGNLEGNFTIGTFLKKLDAKYYKINDDGKLTGDKYSRLDEHLEIDEKDSEKLKPIEQNTSVYYYTDVKFTKN